MVVATRQEDTIIVRALAAALVLGLAAPMLAAAPCPLNQILVTGAPGSSDTNLPADSRVGALASAAYDIPAGTLRAAAGASDTDQGYATLIVQDEFHLVGLAPGTPVALVAHLGGTGVSAHVEIHDAYDHAAANDFDPTVRSTMDLTLDLAVVSDRPFIVQYDLAVSGGGIYGSDGANLRFSFTGVPPGVAVVSCNGYVSESTVPVRRATWGRLKSRYR